MRVFFRRFVAIAALSILISHVGGQEAPGEREKAVGNEKPAAKVDPALVRKLIEELRSNNFKTRDLATRQLSELDEVPDALRQAVKDDDLEVSTRARHALKRVNERLEDKAFQALVADLHKVELDRFVRRMVTDKTFQGERQWDVIQTVAKAVSRKASELGGKRYKVPDLWHDGIRAGNRVLIPANTDVHVTPLDNSVVLCAGSTPMLSWLSHAVVIADGDFRGASDIRNSLLIIRGNVGRIGNVQDSIILATGNLLGANCCRDSFFQAKNQRILAINGLFFMSRPRITVNNGSQALDPEVGPLQLLKFSERKSDAQLVWGKVANDLALAIAVTDDPNKILLRWKNVGKGLIEMPWQRFHTDWMDRWRDDLWGRVLLNHPGGKPVLAAQMPKLKRLDGARLVMRSIVLGPGQSHDEVIDLWAGYLLKKPDAGKYELTIELDIPAQWRGLELQAKLWAGTIRSNTLEITLVK